MTAATQLYDLLLAQAPVAAIVEDRVYKTIVPDGKPTPAIAYRRSSTEYVQTIHGPLIASKPTFDIYCIARDNIGAEQLGNLIEHIEAGLTFIDRIDDYDPETGLFATIITVDVWQTT